MSSYDYIREGDAIYARSFAIIRAESDLSRFAPGVEERLAVRIIHACGMPDIATGLVFAPGAAEAGAAALAAGALARPLLLLHRLLLLLFAAQVLLRLLRSCSRHR